MKRKMVSYKSPIVSGWIRGGIKKYISHFPNCMFPNFQNGFLYFFLNIYSFFQRDAFALSVFNMVIFALLKRKFLFFGKSNLYIC